VLRQIGLAAVAALISFAHPASALTYDFTFQGGLNDPNVSGWGTFTTDPTNSLVIAGSGTFSVGSLTDQATTLFPVTADTAGLSSDNVYPIDSAAGLLFQGTSNTSFFANIFAPTGQTLHAGKSDAWFSATNGSGYLLGSLGFDGVCSYCVADGTLSITRDSVSATPIPATWGMMLLGLGVLGFLGFRAKPRSSLAAA
jgi:hypothetical protein